MESLSGVNIAKNNSSGRYLIINYNDLINSPETTIHKIYSFCNWKPFKHKFKNIHLKYNEDDSVYGLTCQHSIRSKLRNRNLSKYLSLPTSVLGKLSSMRNIIHQF